MDHEALAARDAAIERLTRGHAAMLRRGRIGHRNRRADLRRVLALRARTRTPRRPTARTTRSRRSSCAAGPPAPDVEPPRARRVADGGGR